MRPIDGFEYIWRSPVYRQALSTLDKVKVDEGLGESVHRTSDKPMSTVPDTRTV
jgi:hypothetical protein